MRCKKKMRGACAFFIGVGMILQFMMPAWGFLVAAGLCILGFWLVFSY
jgi:hypothetical protein